MEDRYLFRGKRKDNGKWVFGDLIQSVYKIGDTCVGQFGNEVGIHEVDPETICQCTGLNDKNGKLIWENDVIRCNYETCIVKWEKSEWRIKWIDEAVWRRDLDYWVNESKREVNVVGNIFDNPELLEV